MTTAAELVRRLFVFVMLSLPFSTAMTATPELPLYVGSSAHALVKGNQAELLDEAIANFEAIRDAGGWPMPGDGPPLARGMRHEDVRYLRRRLRITGDYAAEMGADPLMFDAELERELRKFQQNHGLPVNGMVGILTREALNISVDQRIAELRRARAAWAEYGQADMSSRLWVNIPEATLFAFADNQIAMQMRAVVGHPSRPTPVISSAVNRVVINPTWTVPTSIAVKDIVPRQIRNGNYLNSSRIRVFNGWEENAQELDPKTVDWTLVSSSRFPYRLRQDPGPFNSLGRMKFIFPNDHDIYLHDTPTRALLGLSYRSVSSGCIRLEKPELLANWLVAESSRERLQGLLASRDLTPKSLRVRESVPIDLVYLTAWVSPDDGSIQFRRDIYSLNTAEPSFAAR
ncbi:MAG: L,D-transpeptidase family protein [Gammaproteobacteria bacterium]